MECILFYSGMVAWGLLWFAICYSGVYRLRRGKWPWRDR